MKLLSACLNYALSPVVDSVVPRIQSGFVRGRNFGLNVLDMDASARCCSFSPNTVQHMPTLVSLDYGQAFTSLCQAYMILVLRAMGMPIAVVEFVVTFYRAVRAVGSIAGSLTQPLFS